MSDYENQRGRIVSPVLGSKEAMVDEQGAAVIPEGTGKSVTWPSRRIRN